MVDQQEIRHRWLKRLPFAIALAIFAFFFTVVFSESAAADHCRYSGGGWLCVGIGDPHHQDPPVDRLGGADRFETASLISVYEQNPDETVLIVASGVVPYDALAAGTHLNGPMVLVPSGDDVPRHVLDVAFELAPERVIVLGGTAAVSESQAREIQAWAFEGARSNPVP